MKYTLLVPTLNEVVGMNEIMPQIDRDLFHQIIIIDGGSTDGTIEYCIEHNYDYVIQTEKGMRHAYRCALPKITGDIIITFSPDGNSDASRLKPLIEKMNEGHDMVIVSRYKDWATSDDDDILTSFGNWLFTKTVNIFFSAKYTDVMVMYRAFKTSLIEQLELDEDKHYTFVEKIYSTNISWEPLLSARAARMKLKLDEIPGDEPARIGGERKLQVFKWGAAYYTQFIFEFFKRFTRGAKI